LGQKLRHPWVSDLGKDRRNSRNWNRQKTPCPVRHQIEGVLVIIEIFTIIELGNNLLLDFNHLIF
jgi:hypothetical protein